MVYHNDNDHHIVMIYLVEIDQPPVFSVSKKGDRLDPAASGWRLASGQMDSVPWWAALIQGDICFHEGGKMAGISSRKT